MPQQQIIVKPASGQPQPVPVVMKMGMIPQTQQAQPKIVYVQAPQQLTPSGQRGAPVYIQPIQSAQAQGGIQMQSAGGPGSGGMVNMQSEQKAPFAAFADPNAGPAYEKQSSEGNVGGTAARIIDTDGAPPAYFDIEPSAPALSVSVGMGQDLDSFLRNNDLDAHDASLREAGAESLDYLKGLSEEEIKVVAIDAGMDEQDQRLFVDACTKLKQ